MRVRSATAFTLRACFPLFWRRSKNNPLAAANNARISTRGMHATPIAKRAFNKRFFNNNLAFSFTHLTCGQDGQEPKRVLSCPITKSTLYDSSTLFFFFNHLNHNIPLPTNHHHNKNLTLLLSSQWIEPVNITSPLS